MVGNCGQLLFLPGCLITSLASVVVIHQYGVYELHYQIENNALSLLSY